MLVSQLQANLSQYFETIESTATRMNWIIFAGAYRDVKAESGVTGARENATTVSVRARVDQEESSSSEEEEEDVVSALDRNNQSMSAEPEQGRTGQSEQKLKGSRAKVDKLPVGVFQG